MRFSRKVAAVAATVAAAGNSPGRANWSPWKPPQSQSGVHSYVHLPLSRRVCNTPLTPLSLHKLASLFAPLDSSVLSPFSASRALLLPFSRYLLHLHTILLPFILFFSRVSLFRYNLPTRFLFYLHNHPISLSFRFILRPFYASSSFLLSLFRVHFPSSRSKANQ